MVALRKPFQGLTNIVRFNWHYYVLAGIVLALVLLLVNFFPASYRAWCYVVVGFVLLTTFVSLATSYYVYDCSNLYKVNWLDAIISNDVRTVINVNAGFDETSE